MAAQTKATVADWGQLFLTPGSTKALSALPNPLGLDLLQILDEGGKTVIKVSKTGVVSQNPVSETSQVLFGRYYTRLKSTATIAQIFADVFSQNNAKQDIIQVRAQGGVGVWHLDYTGTAFSS